MKLALAIMVAVLVGGCASSTQTYTPDGRVAHSINCSGTARNWGMCQEKAGELCGTRGYEIISTTGDRGAVVTASGGNLFAGTTISRTMLIACK